MAIIEAIKGVASQHLLDLGGLWALLALIPLILVYLIRPKPKKQTIPALMFLMKESAKSDKTSFFRRFIKDPLFLLQIIVLLAFVATIAKPYITANEDIFVEKTAIVVDVSGSMQTQIDGKTRLDLAKEIAIDNIGSNNALILMTAVPELVEDNLDTTEVRREINRIMGRDTPTNIFDSIIFASDYVSEKDRIIVISDFVDSATNKDFTAAKSIVESKGIIVDLINVRDVEARKPKNIGIVDVDIKEDTTTIQIKNFNDDNESVNIKLEGAELSQEQIFIESKGVEVVSFPTVEMLSKFYLDLPDWQDDFPTDNELFLSAPSKEPVPLLLLSNKKSKYLSTALDVLDMVTVDRGMPPQVPDIAHNIIIIDNVVTDLILPGTIKKIKKQVENGALLVVFAQDGILGLDLQGMLPVDRMEQSGPVIMNEDQTVFKVFDSDLTEDVYFGRTSRYLRMRTLPGAQTIASTNDNSTIIALRNIEKGMVVYFGLMDEHSTFKEDIYYPVFWKRLFDLALKKQDTSELNYRTGKLVNLLEKQKITAPKGKVNADTILLNHQGIYRGEEKTFVANLLNEEESNINGESIGEKKGVFEIDNKGTEKVKFELVHYFIIALIAMVFLELLYIKFRGDL